ncbi:MAG: hypothetical protein QUU85_03260 [Candidatus Eisenbacteria bacterium]|nr:hypothetical protein [Candidatus Eisenbacteria bacterium]
MQQRLGGSWVLDAVADSASSSVWSADYLLGAVREHSWDGELLREFEALGARAVAVPPVGGGCWVALYPSATLERRTGGGQLLWADSTAGHVEDLLSLPAQFDERLWAVNSEGQANVYRDQERQTIEGFTRPVALARSGAGDVLLLDRGTGRVHRYDPSGEPKATSEALFADAVDICRDGGNGAWVADPGRAQVIHLDAGLAVTDSIAVDGVLGLAWDDEQGKLWTVGLSGLRVFGESGERTASLSLGPRPVAIAILHISRR